MGSGAARLKMLQNKTEKLILIVDDCKDIRDVYCRFLTREGYRVASTGDGKEAVSEAARIRPDLILMDLSLPGMGGWAATEKLKREEITKDIPVIILTAYRLDGLETLMEEGCAGVLMKPCMPEHLLKEIVRVLQHRAA
jgi:two-component system cell cycle response regulator DivK